MTKYLSDLRWVPLLGKFEQKDGNELIYTGYEYDPPPIANEGAMTAPLTARGPKLVSFGILVFNQRFREGGIKCQIEFDSVDYRSTASIILQHYSATGDLLTFGLAGGGLPPGSGTGPLFTLRTFATRPDLTGGQQGVPNGIASKIWTPLAEGGEGSNLQPNRAYDLEVIVHGSYITAFVDSVEVIRRILPIPSLPGQQIGILCGSDKKVRIRNLAVNIAEPKAFVVMQFNTQEYEALFKDVVKPICEEAGLQPYRGDSTYLPGLVMDDIKKQIAQSRVVIAEITPANANVYYEVGYADALNKPLILISDQKEEGQKPFDIGGYRTIFYENSIGGKNKVETDLRNYLKNIMNQ